MELILQLVNETTLPDGGPVSCRITGKRGVDIGRAAHLDWTLPDPTRYISSKHCEIRYRDGAYWLHDVSTNGTFLNGADHRMHSPHRLRDGDKLAIGQYIVAVIVEEDESTDNTRPKETPLAVRSVNDEDWWATDGTVPPPIDPKELRLARDKSPVHPDFLDWAADVPAPFYGSPRDFSQVRAAPPPPSDMDWAAGPPSRLQPQPSPPPPMPKPARPALEPEANSSGAARPAAALFSSDVNDVFSTQTKVDGSNTVIGALVKAAGISEDVLALKDSAELAQQVGIVLRLLTENLMQLLSARQQAKRLARTTVHTSIDALNNNPLKFSPSPHDALRIMFGPAHPGYLDAERAISQAFDDLKAHQLKTYSAMQHALTTIMADLDPETIERETDGGGAGIGGLLQPRKAKLWDAYEARWQAKVGQKGSDPIEAFMRYFGEYYDRDEK